MLLPAAAIALLAPFPATAAEPPRAAEDPPHGSFIADDGSARDVDVEYERFHDLPPPHHVRSFLFMGVGLGLFSAGYWSTATRQFPDWDNPTLRARVNGDAWRFDNNTLVVNFTTHPLGGGISYALARANHNGVLVSAAYTALASSLWEFVFEFHEQVSVNDFIVTPLTGIPVGEFAHKLGLYLDSARRSNVLLDVARWGLTTGVQVDRVLDREPHFVPEHRDRLGARADLWHDFELDGGVASTVGATGAEYLSVSAGARGRLVSIPGYLRRGSFEKTFTQADVSDFELRMDASKHGPAMRMRADTLIAGVHAQRIRGPERVGHAVTTGLSIGYRLHDSRASDFREQLGVAHLLGPGLDYQLLARGVRLEITARSHVDFAGAGVLAYGEWRRDHRGEIGKHILRLREYFYGWGASAEVGARLGLGPLRAHGALFYGKYRSQEGLGRWQEHITIDVPAASSFLQYDVGVALSPSGSPVSVGARAELRRFDTWVGGYLGQARALSRGLFMSARF